MLDGPINGQSFTAWVEHFLVPTLSPGDIVIMDNLARPHCAPELVEGPIKQVFAKLKLLMRKAAERSIEDCWQRIGSLLDDFSPRECAAYLRNSGYAST